MLPTMKHRRQRRRLGRLHRVVGNYVIHFLLLLFFVDNVHSYSLLQPAKQQLSNRGKLNNLYFDKILVLKQKHVTQLYSTRNVNDNGEPISDLHSTIQSSILDDDYSIVQRSNLNNGNNNNNTHTGITTVETQIFTPAGTTRRSKSGMKGVKRSRIPSVVVNDDNDDISTWSDIMRKQQQKDSMLTTTPISSSSSSSSWIQSPQYSQRERFVNISIPEHTHVHTDPTSKLTTVATIGTTPTSSSSTTTTTSLQPQKIIDIINELSTSNKSKNDNNNKQILDVLQPYDNINQIQSYWDRLRPTLQYLQQRQEEVVSNNDFDEDLSGGITNNSNGDTIASNVDMINNIYKALIVAYHAHYGQIRKSGEPFIIHPLEVALLLSGLKMDAETVMAGLLHDTVEDTELTFDQVEEYFGRTVRGIVEGETKVSKLPKQLAISEYADEQAENLRQMFVAMTDDYRIIIVKLADRLHNMRTLKYMKPEKQIKISRETLDIFAPLAHRMGIWQFKSELEDTAFKYLYPDEYKRLNRRLRQHQKRFKDTLNRSQEMLQRRLDSDVTLQQQAAKVEVFGRRKEIYSLWHKMETKNESNLENIMDVVAVRVIITPKGTSDNNNMNDETDKGVWLCYHVLGLVQHLHGFQPVPTKVKDYISFPKPNGYQSLHTALILDGQSIEVQIRTRMMHQVAEYGMASHWAYTESKRMKNGGEGGLELYKTPWLSSIKEWQNDRISSRDFVDSVRRELLGKRVFVFLRNGKILNLARGATAIDAAFQIHTEIGLTMHGVEINGKPVPFSYELRNGDVVSILTGNGKPATDWMRYAKSRSTRSKLRAYFRARQKESLREAGKILIMDYLWMHGQLIEKESLMEEEFKVPTLNVEELRPLLSKTQYEDLDDLLIILGRDHDRNLLHKVVSQMFDVPRKLFIDAEESSNRRYGPNTIAANPLKLQSTSRNTTTPRTLYTVDNLLSRIVAPSEVADPEHICKVCLPVLGDAIVGTRRSDQDPATTMPTVHRMGCPHSQKAINRAWAEQRDREVVELTSRPIDAITPGQGPKVDSFTLRHRNWVHGSRKQETYERLVKLEWSDLDENNPLFLVEVVVVAVDRKLLLADCSIVVSENVEIVKTGSITTNEHATLVFLVKVSGLDTLQDLMDRLGRIRSVMSVERRFGSDLMH